MIALLIVLVVTNLLTAAAVIWLWRERIAEEPATTPEVAEVLESIAAQPGAVGVRRVISVEILNPIDLAGTRGRVVGIAGSFAPSITRRLVNEQAVKALRRQLAEQRVVADVRLHTLRPHDADPAPTAGTTPRAPFGYVDEMDADGPEPTGTGPSLG